jgi:HNH endonuclease
MLWGRAAGRCSKPDCRIDLYEDETETDDPTLLGENCHIIAESDDGPRADPRMPLSRRNDYRNLILLCRNHHKLIDAQEGEYPVETLHRMKATHEAWVKEQLGFDEARQFDEEQYAGMIDTWERLAHVDHWRAWSSHVLSYGQPGMSGGLDRDLEELRCWLLNRVWPGRYADLERAFENFRRILEDFQGCFRWHAEERKNGNLVTRRFYQIEEWNEELYHKLLRQFEFHVDLVSDLMLELSRAGNLICDRVRQHLKRGYRLGEGRLMVQSGPHANLTFHDFVVQYCPEDRARDFPYPGLQAFLTAREQRDRHFGEGTEP